MEHDLILREIQMRQKMPEDRQTQKASSKLRKTNPRAWLKVQDKSEKYLFPNLRKFPTQLQLYTYH